jgi:methionyl-tRNA formyltransferase
MSAPVRTAFFGTPGIAVPALQALAATTDLVGVVCQPDRPAGRGMKITAPAVKEAAQALGVPVHQPVKVRTGDLHTWLLERRVDAAIVLAYGRILPPSVLAAPPLGCVNLHASLLPRYRGAAPIQWALIRGEAETGISVMQMDPGLDTGPVYCARRILIDPDENAGSLSARIAELAADVVREDLPRVLTGELRAQPQDDTRATLAPPIDKSLTRIDFSRPAQDIKNLVRGLAPRPGASTRVRGRALKILAVTVEDAPCDAAPGTVLVADASGVRVATGGGSLWVESAQPEGRTVQTGRDLVNGRAVGTGDVLGA